MVESPTEAPAAPAEAAAAGAPAESAAEIIEKAEVSIRELLEAGVHFGHQTRRWNPLMKPYIYGERNGIHIVNLDTTLGHFRDAIEVVKETVGEGGRVLFVGTKRQAQGPIKLEAERSKQFYVNHRWLGGMLTNFRTVKKSIEIYKQKLALLEDEEKVGELSKKELARHNRMVTKYSRSLEGMKEMTRLPDLMFVVDVNREHIAVAEGQRLGIPIVAVVDTNCSPRDIDYVIPGNDDATRAIQLYCSRVADACLEGEQVHQEQLRAQPQQESAARSEEAKPGSPTGRVVVEITQPPRRGRGSQQGGQRTSRGAGGTATAGREAPEAAPAAAAPAAPAPTPAPEAAADPAPAADETKGDS